MADEGATETEVVQTTEDNSTSTETQTTGDPAAEIPSGEVTTETPPDSAAPTLETVEAEKLGWDKERQKRDEERARREKELAEQNEALRAAVLKLSQNAPPATQEQKDEFEEAASLMDQAEKSDDPFEAVKLQTKANKLLLNNQREQAKWRKEQEAKSEQANKDQSELELYFEANPTIDREKAIVARQEGYRIAAKLGYSGEAADKRMREYYASQIKSLTKSNTPAPKSATPKTAVATGSTTPPGTKVTPVATSVRPAAVQRGNAEDEISKALMG